METYVPHLPVWIELELEGVLDVCGVCGRNVAVHPDYLDVDVEVED